VEGDVSPAWYLIARAFLARARSFPFTRLPLQGEVSASKNCSKSDRSSSVSTSG
jgi:hypothetical protein